MEDNISNVIDYLISSMHN